MSQLWQALLPNKGLMPRAEILRGEDRTAVSCRHIFERLHERSLGIYDDMLQF